MRAWLWRHEFAYVFTRKSLKTIFWTAICALMLALPDMVTLAQLRYGLFLE